ncbi:cysteine desulfurase family protein [Paenibacillus cisolokensis]
MNDRHYFDHAASSPLHPDVAETMLEVMRETVGNASSMHAFGRAARQRINRARDLIAEGLGCEPGELMFTSGGTESDNAGIAGTARARRKQGKTHIITSAVEHHAVLHTCDALEQEGFRVTRLPVDETGRVSVDDVREALTPDTAVVTIMHGNNEVGTIQPIEEIGELTRAAGVPFHVDAVQSLGTEPIDLGRLPVDLMSFSAHKINGPQGVGALYIARGTPFEPLLHGGNQERKRRPGTENVAAIAGFARAFERCVNERETKKLFLDKLRSTWIERLAAIAGEDRIAVNGNPLHRLPHIANISFAGLDTETLLMNLDLAGVAASSGSACTSGSLERSHVLKAMNLPRWRLESAVRFSFGLGNTMEEIELAAQKIETILRRARTTDQEAHSGP